jgi:hypothetical protein
MKKIDQDAIQEKINENLIENKHIQKYSRL